MVNNKNKYKIDYFFTRVERNADIKASTELTQEAHDECKDVFTGIKCFKGTFSLQVRERA